MAADGGNKRRSWRFADGDRVFRLFPDRHQLLEGDAEVEIGARAFDLLVYFAEHAGRAVGKKEILAQVWSGLTVTTSAVSTQVSEIRAALDFNCIISVNHGYQFTPEVESIDLPAAPAGPSPITLPHSPDEGVGRVAELAELAALCARHRLVTIVGPGGVGKTWLAVKLGWRLVEPFPDGVHLLDLGPVKEPLAVAGTVAQALGMPLRRGDDPVRLLAAKIDRQRLLLIFDSCEYAIGPVRELVKNLLLQAPNLTVLATSQEPLGLSNEELFPLAPLLPADAEALFVRRVQAAGLRQPQNDQNNAAIVAAICSRLDGIPLALELAAARVPALGIEGLRDGLDHRRFRMLDVKKRNGEARQATLSAMVEWSFGLLDEADRQVFRRLSRFRGSFSHEAAHAVAGFEGDEWETGACLGRLVEKSLLVAEGSKRPRYRMLETLRFYAEARLDECGEADSTARRHAQFYTDLFERADDAWETVPDQEWTALYGPEIDNLRVALDWAMAEPERRPEAIALCGAGAHLWERLNLSAEVRGYLDRLIEYLDDETPTADAARVLQRASTLWRRVDRVRASAFVGRSVAQYRRLGDRARLGGALGLAGGDYVFFGRYEEAKAALAEAQTLLSGSKRIKSSLRVTLDLATLAQRENRVDDAKSAFQAARDLARTLKDPLREYIGVNNLAVLEFRIGNVVQATEHFRDAASGYRSISQPAYLGLALLNLAACLALQDADAEARTHVTEALSLTRADGGSWLRLCLECWAFLAARAGQYAESARLLGFVDAGVVRSGEVRAPLSQRVYDEATRLLAAHCAADDIRAWADDGADWSETQAADFASRRLVTPESCADQTGQ